MKENNSNSITLPELLWKLLSRWWVIILFAALGAGIMYVYAGRNYDEKMKLYETENASYLAQLENYDRIAAFNEEYRNIDQNDDSLKKQYAEKLAEFCKANLTEDQMNSIDDAMSIRKHMADTTKMVENQVLLKTDPYNLPTLNMIYSVYPENPDHQGTINNYYQNDHNSRDLWTKMYNAMGISADRYSDYTGCEGFGFLNGYQFNLTFTYDNLDALPEVQAKIEEVLNALRDEISNYGLPHCFMKEEVPIYTRVDFGVAGNQLTYQQWVIDDTNRLNSLKNTFSYNPIQSDYYSYLVDLEEGGTGYVEVSDMTKPKQDDAAAKQPKSTMFYLLIGAAVGLCLGIGLIMVLILFAGRLQKPEELKELFGIQVLGTLISTGFRFPLEKFIVKMKTAKYGKFDLVERAKYTALKIKALCDAQGIKQVALSGTAVDDKKGKTVEELVKALNKSGIKAEKTGNMLVDSLAFEKVLKAGCVIFIEKEVKSSYKNIRRELIQVDGCETKVLGSVYIY